jgi:hypothetical protein
MELQYRCIVIHSLRNQIKASGTARPEIWWRFPSYLTDQPANQRQETAQARVDFQVLL